MIILGLDPGLACTGFGAVICQHDSLTLSAAGHVVTSPRDPLAKRLNSLFEDLNELLSAHSPELLAIENVFSTIRYPKAGIILGQVMGIIYLSAQKHELHVLQITPKEVKNSLVGSGSATKNQIKSTIKRILCIEELSSTHASDAVAVALTAYYRKRYFGQHDFVSGRPPQRHSPG